MPRPTVFISYSHKDKVWLERLVTHLEVSAQAGALEIWDDRRIAAGSEWLAEIESAIGAARAAILLISADFLTSEFICGKEIPLLLERRSSEGLHIFPFIVRSCNWRVVSWLAKLQVRPADARPLADFRGNQRHAQMAAIANEVHTLLARPEPPPPVAMPGAAAPTEDAIPGMAPRDVVFGPQPLPGQVFAIELLTQPIVLSRSGEGRIWVTVNRDHVTDALYTTEGKRHLCDRIFEDPSKRECARQLERDLHTFLSGRSTESSFILPLDELPLRWASGGVFSIVRWRSRTWTPFFFRDIEPWGWNISLGASEQGDDLNDPWTFLLREFLEETLVLKSEPRAGEVVHYKRLFNPHLNMAKAAVDAESFASDHIHERFKKDGLVIPLHVTAAPSVYVNPNFGVRMDVRVVKDHVPHEHRSVLVCINLLELGVEVVLVLEYSLEPDDSILDGEILERGAAPRELVRMPVALISHDYLARAFGTADLKYEGEVQPSVEAPPIPPEDIHIFPFDAYRRRKIALGEEERASQWEREHYKAWMKRFGVNFFDDAGKVSNANASRLFTPTSAKIVSYYMAHR